MMMKCLITGFLGKMQKGTKSKCASVSHNLLLDNAKNRLNDLQERFSNLQAARMEGRASDVAVLEEQVYQSLREWKAELDAPSPASSLVGGSLGTFSEDIGRLLQLCEEEEDDATSPLVEQSVLKPEPNIQSVNIGNFTAFEDDYFRNSDTQVHSFQGFDQCNNSLTLQNTVVSTSDMTAFLDYQQFISDEGFDLLGTNDSKEFTGSVAILPIGPAPSAFMGPKCALWDCARPAQGSEWFEDYCSSFHATLALNEGPPGKTPVLRPSGIGLKDNLLFTALNARHGRSYYMDPQPPGCYGWHLYEYEISNSDACALYRLELKFVDEKKTPKGKVMKDSLADLQKKMGRLTADNTGDNSPSSKTRTRTDKKTEAGGDDLTPDQKSSDAKALGHDSIQSSSK
ncbi:conserved hypothetical protein [Ricinus communis]|uniref:Transcription factor VOZ1 n=1 Tax=Ricinus communis TaxID=3988 RepID=B9SGN7_RICCO|nr:conserved hypothetical protein [Ricinus communis]